MKRSVYYLIGVIIIALTLIILIKAKTNLIDIEVSVKFVDELKEEKIKTVKVCVFDKYDNFNFVDVEVESNIDIYLYIFEVYNFRRNSLPIGYEVPSSYLLELVSIKKDGHKLFIETKESKMPEVEIIQTLNLMLITYKYLDIKEISLKIGKISYESHDYFLLK